METKQSKKQETVQQKNDVQKVSGNPSEDYKAYMSNPGNYKFAAEIINRYAPSNMRLYDYIASGKAPVSYIIENIKLILL